MLDEDKPKVCKKTNQVNYLFTLGFILAIVIFLVLLILISRSVLSNGGTISEHVKLTKDLLTDVNKVNLEVNNKSEIVSTGIDVDFDSKLEVNSKNIMDFNYYNVNDNKSIFTFFLDRKIYAFNDMFYIKYNNFDEFKKNDLILYYGDLEDIPKLGRFVNFKEELIVVYDFDSKELKEVDFEDILGRVIFLK